MNFSVMLLLTEIYESCILLRMTLQQYLALVGETQQQFASSIGVSQNTVSRYVNGLTIPRREQLRRIVEVTDGAVTPTDFVFPDGNASSHARQGKLTN
jgi:transcriptional regulator with XRE-family HTH domain